MQMKNWKSLILIIGLSLILQSCFVAEEYERDEQAIDELKYRTENIATDTTNLADRSWRQIFTDTLLQDHISEALKNNQDIRIALEQIKAGNALFKQGKAGYYPSININGQYTHQELAPNSQFGSFFSSLDQYELSAGLSWEADIWGKITSQERAAEADYLRTKAAHKAVKTALIAQVATAYYQLMAIDEQIAITQETINNRENSLSATRALKEAGDVTSVAVSQTKAQLHTAEAILIDLKNEARLLENTISVLKGEQPMAIQRASFDTIAFESRISKGVPMDLLENRPDVRQAEFNLRNAFQMKNVARSDFYPSITLSATSGFQRLDIAEFIDPNSIFTTLIGGLTQPVFNRRQIKTQLEVAKAEEQQAYLNFEKTLINAAREVTDALYNFQNAKEGSTVKQKEYQAYQQAVDDAQLLLENGSVNYLEVLNARENALSTKLELVNTRLQAVNAQVELYRSLGGGWR